ncbi:type II secretion system minor pseudopilin GspK [Alcaligenes nematophilus]|uniref:type II secretion system minor pseudopilin GspK n=1 Tax=Alcaligenes nematophilus TaxID=2994643 RepID=UPI0034E0938B
MAVIAVLVVVAIVAVLAAALMARQATAIRAAQAEQTRVQARWLLQGEISRAQVVLLAEAQREPSTRLDGLWHRPMGGEVVGSLEGAPARLFSEIVDEQSKFNLRNLVSVDQVDPAEAETFLRLCALVGVPQEKAQRIARRVVVSLVEAERRVEASGATSPAMVEELKRARSAAQQLGFGQQLPTQEQAPRLRTLDDMLVDDAIDSAVLERLRPYVTVLPARTRTNANTARPEVLAATIPGLQLDRARALTQARDGGQWFLNRGDIFNRLQMQDRLSPSSLRVGVTSRWFRVTSALQAPRTIFVVNALLHDDKQTLPQVVWLREGV